MASPLVLTGDDLTVADVWNVAVHGLEISLAESAKGRIWTVEPKDVEGVTITRKGETVRLKRTTDAAAAELRKYL